MKKTKLLTVGMISLMSLFIFTACQNKPTDTKIVPQSMSSDNQDSMKDTSSAMEKAAPNFAVSLTDGIALFQETFPETDITAIDIDSSFDQWYYKIEGVNDSHEFELRINATTKEIDQKKEEALDPEDINGKKRQEEKLSLENLTALADITKTAEQAAQSGVATDWELEKELDITYWKVTVKDGNKEVEVKVDAQKNTVLATETDD